MSRLFAWLRRKLLAHAASREPDFVIGGPDQPYLKRWWIIPRNRLCNVYLHQILRSDDDRALHSHPWPNWSLILSGWYFEVVPWDQRQPAAHDFRGKLTRQFRTERDTVFRWPGTRHRLEVSAPCWSLFITGPVVRNWFFFCPKGPVPWREFVDERDSGAVGKGCA